MSHPVPSDVYGTFNLLTPAEQLVLKRLRELLDSAVKPHLNQAWEAGEFPEQIVQPLIDARLMDPPELEAAGIEPAGLFAGLRNFELARADASVATFYNAQSGLFRTVVKLGGSEEQFRKLDPKIADFSLKGVFALTEPEHGSDIAGGLETAAVAEERDGVPGWLINGSKRWIGGASQADVLALFARDQADSQVKCFLVPTNTVGVKITKMTGKTSLRIMQNADIDLHEVWVPDSSRLARINSFADVAACLRNMRSDVAWIATGAMAGAYEAALRYTTARTQFGTPLAGFQLVQEKLARMLGNVTASLAMVTRLTQQQELGIYRDENSALAKMFTARILRETAALAREVCGGNGIILDNEVARFHADAEAIYSYEGTHEINSLIVARAATGLSAFK